MAVSDDDIGPAGSTPRSRIEIGPAPTGDHTSRWIRLGLVAVVALVLVRLVVRIRRP